MVTEYVASGQLDVKPIIGGVWPIAEWHEAFEKMHKGEVVKSVLSWSGEWPVTRCRIRWCSGRR